MHQLLYDHPVPLASPTMSSTATKPKAQLYSFDGSVWASVPRLCLIEKGYDPSDVEFKTVNLLSGENFSPAYIRINANATIPTLVVPLAETISSEVDTKFRAITGTQAVIEFLDKSRNVQVLDARGESHTNSAQNAGTANVNPAPMLSPATVEAKAEGDRLIKLVTADNVDPNMLLLSARNQQELEKQRSDGAMQMEFCRNRLAALQKYKGEAQASASSTENPRTQQQNTALLKWYDDKIATLAPLNKAYLDKDAAASLKFIEAGVQLWKNVAALVAQLENEIRGPFILGGQISLVDLQVGAWLARVQAVAKGLYGDAKDSLDALDAALQWDGLGDAKQHVGPNVRAYWKHLMERPSFQEVYSDGVH